MNNHPRSGTVLQEVFARKRETEQLRTEKNSAVAQYYDKWGRITSRFENWTTPEYYEQSDQQLRREEEEKQRKEQIIERREKLRELLASEKAGWEREMKEQSRNKSRPGSATSTVSSKHTVDVLQRLNSTLSEQERRRKEIEAKLYSRWRFGMTRDDLMLEAKNHHQAMAKLNWLDQQVEEQLERDRSDKEFEALEMKRQSEQLREEEIAQQTRQSREREIAQLNKMLEMHMVEFKTHDASSKARKEQMATLRDVKLSLAMKKEEVVNGFAGRSTSSIPMHNMRRLKVIIAEYCQGLREEITKDAAQLTEIKGLLRDQLMGVKEEKHFQLVAGKFDQELVELKRDVENFANMYDSEVKSGILKQQQVWKENSETRFRLLKNLVEELIEKCELLMSCSTEEMASLAKLKESHLKEIDDLNGKLQGLSGRVRRDYSASSSVSSLDSVSAIGGGVRVVKSTQQPPFVSLGEQLEGLRLAPDSIGASDRMENGTPRFGRKRVAWC